ncbi:hypothetical protein [Kangiella koreensis]|uniref:Uncharacterized protein n=1 Tax=Kangiella koreensis (strain DSM 16069 / JCM 12317 / KCTC 12182 / SW-125) TaxID=523791 RepID=C7R7P8_KANKD|nr:hypothetical protein [Kangiella koreensis]ACV27581.1 hypothetical protein Kkor_2171 [Kangiella koreensis DSM 16069]
MKALGRLALVGIITIEILITGTTIGCQQQTIEPRIDTSNQQVFNKSLNQVRSQLDAECIEQFDRAINYALHTYQLQKQYSLLPTSNPLNGLNAEEVLKLPTKNQEHSPRRIRNWTSI